MSGGGAGEGDLAALEARLGHRFADPGLLELALTHRSAAQERDGTRGNERLEFLGDAVLDLAVSRLLYETHPGWEEGDLTRSRAGLVNAASLAERARALGIGAALRLGRTERCSAGAEKGSILANALEAVVGALYLDAGLGPVLALVRRIFPEAADPGGRPPLRDPKTRLNELASARGEGPPRYRTLADRGEEAGAQRYRVAAELESGARAEAEGASKRAAERAAAELLLAGADEPARPAPAGAQADGPGDS